MTSGHILQIFLRVTVQNQIRIAQRIIVDSTPVQSMEIILPSRSSSSTQPVSMLNLQALSSYFMFVSFLPYGTFTVVTSDTCFFDKV